MVDLCARAGLVNKAWDLIKKMPGKPDEIVLGSLPGACQRRRNADVGERVIQLFPEMQLSHLNFTWNLTKPNLRLELVKKMPHNVTPYLFVFP
ncbi:hypothetical protein POTOM_003526 [Populus tomentosa]|uniref:Pentatricopeptide repeat-containing protein n=1 Tax=Populus tomentosa TaxID=118781 RepID=A0A8X8J0M7_POPTO|nr:hypothetical protein POTOM_003526 [Populus tomentosa]